MTLHLYNTLGRKKELFQPLQPPKVSIYVCGPTVYDLLHIGNFRGVIFFETVRNWLTHQGYDVTYVLNITDIDDKIIKRAHEENKDPADLSDHYFKEYIQDFKRLQLKPHDKNPKCTHHINDMIQFIDTLIQSNHAYAAEGHVFFDINQRKDYGKLSGKKCDDLQAGHRIEANPLKKNPLDFVLWKPAKDNEPSWDSPWGKGRPGWHIECSAMNHAIFGDQIDIHGGGIDLIFPHHENEIAQSEALTGKPFAKYWVHNNFIRFGDSKMSKSLGNVIKAREFMDQYDPEILKFLLLSVHYRSELSIDTTHTYQTMARLARIYKAIQLAQTLQSSDTNKHESPLKDKLIKAKNDLTTGLNDDINTPIAFAALFDVIREFNHLSTTLKKKNPQLKQAASDFLDFIKEVGTIFSLFNEPPQEFLARLTSIAITEKQLDTEAINQKITDRNQARSQKDYALSDSIRDELEKWGVTIQDTPQGTLWDVKWDTEET